MFKFHGKKSVLKGRQNNFKKILALLIKEHSFQISEINYIFVDDTELLEINRKSLNHDYYTDIITFDLSENKILEGEIYISVDRVKENAKTFSQKFHVELLRVVLHGVLHLLGYNDKTKSQKAKMREMEELYIKKYLNMFHVETKHESKI